MRKFSVLIAGRHATSITLENEFNAALCALADDRKMTLNKLVTEIEGTRTTPNLSSALRLYVLKSLLEKLKSAQD